MEVFFTIFAFLPLLFIVFGVLFGIMRGTKKTLIRFMIILATTAILFVVTKPITSGVLGSLMSGFAADLTNHGVPVDTVNSLISGLFAPLVFLVLFIVVNMLSWIFFAIFTRGVDPQGKLGGAIIGGIAGLFIAIAFMMPFNGYFKFADENHATLTELVETLEEVDVDFPFDIGILDDFISPIRSFNQNIVTSTMNHATIPLFNHLTGGILEAITDVIDILGSGAGALRDLINGIENGFGELTRENMSDIGALLDRVAGNALFDNFTLGSIFGIVSGDVDFTDIVPFDYLDGITNQDIQEIVDALFNLRLSDFNFQQTFTALFDVFQLTEAEPAPPDDEIVTALFVVIDTLPLNLMPQLVRDLIDGFRP